MVVIASLVEVSFAIMAGAVAGGWRRGTLGETVQERYDREFERIVPRLRR